MKAVDPGNAPRPLTFMTFNVRFDTVLDEPGGHTWAKRKASVLETVNRLHPDVVGFQEALKSQLDDLTEGLADYRGVGKPREIGETGEYVPLFFDERRFDVEDHGDFWLSETPDEEGSRGWDSDVPRHCTWAKLADVASGFRFAVFNTHLDVWGTVARLEAAKLIVARISIVPRTPSVVMGDFNAEEDSDALATLKVAGLRDTFRVAHPDAADVQTVHHYTDLAGTKKIDYVMCDESWDVLAADIVREPAAGRLPSDHFPVTAELLPRGS